MTRVLIEEGEAFVFDASVDVIKLDESDAYRKTVHPWLACRCVDFIVRHQDQLVFVEAKNYDREALRPGSVGGKLKALPAMCGQKALGSMAVLTRHGLRDTRNTDFDWAWSLAASRRDDAIRFRLYVRLPTGSRFSGRRGEQQRQRLRRATSDLGRRLARSDSVGWLTREAGVVEPGGPLGVPGLVRVEAAPPLLDQAERGQVLDVVRSVANADERGGLLRCVERFGSVLPAEMRQRLPVGQGAEETFRVRLDWLNADHAARRVESGELALALWLEAVAAEWALETEDWAALLARLKAT